MEVGARDQKAQNFMLKMRPLYNFNIDKADMELDFFRFVVFLGLTSFWILSAFCGCLHFSIHFCGFLTKLSICIAQRFTAQNNWVEFFHQCCVATLHKAVRDVANFLPITCKNEGKQKLKDLSYEKKMFCCFTFAKKVQEQIKYNLFNINSSR